MSDDKLGAKLHSTMDAVTWAEEFVATLKANPHLTADFNLMHTWFANAITVGYDHGRRLEGKKVHKLKALLLLTDPAVSDQEMNSLSAKQFDAYERWEQTQ